MILYKISARAIRYGIKLAYHYIDKGLVENLTEGHAMVDVIAKRYGPQSLITKAFVRKVQQYLVRKEVADLAEKISNRDEGN